MITLLLIAVVLAMYSYPLNFAQIIYFVHCNTSQIGFGGLEVVCWPLVPKFAGSNPAEAVGFLTL